MLPLALSAQPQVFEAQLSGRAEAPPVATQASGEVSAILDGNNLQVSGIFEGLGSAFDPNIAGGAHLHIGYPGENGGIAFPLTTTLDPDLQGGMIAASLNTFSLDIDQMDALMEGRMYVNIHTLNYPGGELRGQLMPEADAQYFINLFGSNEVPSLLTRGAGALMLKVEDDELQVTGSFAGLESDFAADIAGGAHLHLGYAGENGGVDIPLVVTLNANETSGFFEAANNIFTIDADQKSALEERRVYANIHSNEAPGGELRGQVAEVGGTLFRVHLSGANEQPAIVSSGSGQVMAEYRDGELTLSGFFAGLESPVATQIVGGAHLHLGMAGENGPVAIPLQPSLQTGDTSGFFLPAQNTYSLSSEQIDALFRRGMYLNIHTDNFNAGELRGQLLPECRAVFNGNLSGSFEAPPINTSAFGGLKLEWRGETAIVTGSFSGMSSEVDISIAGGAHLHIAPAGLNGDVKLLLASELDSTQQAGVFPADINTFELTENDIVTLRDREFYANIHTLNFPGGELRAQMMAEADYYMYVPLSGHSEMPAANTSGTGALMMEVNGSNVQITGGFDNLISPFDEMVAGGAHLHAGPAGSNGGILFNLNTDVDADGQGGQYAIENNFFSLSPEQMSMLRNRMMYANIHTEVFPGGELRGQVLPLATSYFTTKLRSINEVQPITSSASGGLELELAGNRLTVTGSFSDLQAPMDTTIAGGAHLHVGGPAENGGVELLLNTTLDTSGRNGVYMAQNNTFELTETQISDLRAGNYYANLHSELYAGGEIRGQVLPIINFFPEVAPEVLQPSPGAAILLEGVPSDILGINWSESTDENELAYIWQIALDTAFEQVLFQQNTGADSQLGITFGAVDTLLEQNGVAVDATVTLYHRVQASDGSVSLLGKGEAVILSRGVVTSTDNPFGKEEVVLFPSLTANDVYLKFPDQRWSSAQLQVINPHGQILEIQELGQVFNGSTRQVDVSNLTSGMYFLRLVKEGDVLVRRFMVGQR